MSRYWPLVAAAFAVSANLAAAQSVPFDVANAPQPNL